MRCRSFCFLERPAKRSALAAGGVRAAARDRGPEAAAERWTVFLVTYPAEGGEWRGCFSFRASAGLHEGLEVRTTDLFLEATEAEVDSRARGLGRPLLLALLDSALYSHERSQHPPPDVRRWFRELLARNSAELVPDPKDGSADLSLQHLRSLYASYRLDQVAHLISLMAPADFEALVEQLLHGREIDFASRDRLQLAMIVVEELERWLPLPPFESWVEDYVANREEYQRYSYQLHRQEQPA
ncbi:MAG: hypothetical protein HY703_09915 [Gemmatimonadetes bacterium]|nr:hypothetical protein [Gemmatimonadota bacterium]